jgi:hypothetical protein
MTNWPILVSYYNSLRGLFDIRMDGCKRGYVREGGDGVLVVLGSVGNQLRVVMGGFYIKRKKKVIGACIKTLSFCCMLISSSFIRSDIISFRHGMVSFCLCLLLFFFPHETTSFHKFPF